METNNELTAERSLEIIKKQIELSRMSTEKNAGLPMIIWGSLVCITALIVWYLWGTTGNAAWNFLWFIMAAVGWGCTIYMNKKEKNSNIPITLISNVMNKTWLSFGIFASILPIFIYVVAPLLFDKFLIGYSYTPLVILLLGIATTITGLILKNGWITMGGIIGGIIGFILAVLYAGPYEMLVMAGVGVITLLIPGIMVNRRK